jgi:hypothetical protein
MPHFKCVTCKTRIYNARGPADRADESCPGCGSPFEPVHELAELVGYRVITSADRSAAGDALAAAVAVALPRPETTC